MNIKHKLLNDFQYISPDKKIFVLKKRTILENYDYKLKDEVIPIDKEIVDNNPEFFEVIDWKSELLTYIKANKIPTPSVIAKKLIPFIEDVVISNNEEEDSNLDIKIDNSLLKEIERRESDLREKEDEVDIRLKRLSKRESEYKEDIRLLDKRESDLREKSKEILEKELDLDDKIQDVNEKERNIDRSSLESSKEIDDKYVKLQKKIDSDLKSLSVKERDLENKLKSFSNKEIEFNNKNENFRKEVQKNIYSLSPYKGLHPDLDILINKLNIIYLD